MSDSVHTFTGVWFNWSNGIVRGATLTLEQKYAGLLTAFLAIFVSFAGGMFWRALSFVLHQAYTTRPTERRDILHYRRQVILRNNSAGAAAWSFVQLAFGGWDNVLRCLPFALIPTLNLLLFGVSGIFTSYITKVPGNATLIIGPHCGGFDSTGTDSSLQFTTKLGKVLADTNEAATYVSQCYQNTSSSVGCGTYIRQSLPFITDQNASCPFASGLCLYNDDSAMKMDTGLLDSHEDFGMNARPRDRIKFRRIATCAPIYSRPFTEVTNLTDFGEVVFVNAGPIPGLGTNYTFSYVTHANIDGIGYMLNAQSANADPTGVLAGRQWIPDPKLNQTDADITLIMLSQNGMHYLTPSDDPWMPAHISDTIEEIQRWLGDHDINLMECIDQYQICNPNRDEESGCTILGGSLSAVHDLSRRSTELAMNEQQVWTAARFLITASHRTMYYNVQGRGSSALNAAQTAYNNVQYRIPANQWQIEVSTWFRTSLAKEQAWAVEWATEPKNFPSNPTGEDPGWTYRPPDSPIAKSQCNTQLVRDSGQYQNFSILGMALIIAIGGSIILIGLTIDTVVGWTRSAESRYKSDQWEREDSLSLHKAAYLGFGLWRDDGFHLPPSTALIVSHCDVSGGIAAETKKTVGYVPVVSEAV